jgi:hypothetical protein
MLIDEGDRALIGAREAGDPQIETAAILMRSPADRRNLAQACLEVLRRRPDLGSSQPDKGAS